MGDYQPTLWTTGDTITVTLANHWEQQYVTTKAEYEAGNWSPHPDVVLLDGSRAMTGNLSMGNHSISDVNSFHAVNIELTSGGTPFIDFKNSTDVDYHARLILRSPDKLNFEGDADFYIKHNRVLTTADQGSGNGLDADKLDGQHISDLDNRYINASGDTMTGDLLITTNGYSPSVSSGGSNLAIRANNNLIQFGLKEELNARYGWLQVRHSDINTYGSIYGKLDLNPLGGTVLANGSRVLTTADEGSGSGLDADTVDGHNLFVQSAQPSSPNVNDIWIEV